MRDSVNVRVPRDVWERIKGMADREERTVQATTTRLLRAALRVLDRDNEPRP